MDFTSIFNGYAIGLLGAGLAMDAFSVSLANGLAEPRMSGGRTVKSSARRRRRRRPSSPRPSARRT